MYALLGPNGAGKSTTLKLLLGLLVPDAGTVSMWGRPWERAVLGRVGASIDGPALYPHLSAVRNLEVHARLLSLPPERVRRVLEVVGLAGTGRQRVRTFSTGMRGRLALAVALLGDPELLVLDEPQNGLDPEGVVSLRALIRGFAAQGRTVVVSSHLLGEVVQLADDVGVLVDGRLRYQGELAALAPDGDLERAYFTLTAAAAAQAGGVSSTTTPSRAPLVGVSAAVAAERRRWPGSAAARLPLLGVAAAALQGLLYLAGSTRHGWAALTAWQILWVSFLGPVGIGLLAGLLGRRETTARGGGAWWRPVTGRRAHMAGFVVLSGYALVMQLAVLLAALPFGWVGGLSFPGPVGHLLLVAAALWVSTLALLAVAHQVALRVGLLAATGLGLVWALAGTFTAETTSWWWQPWAWTVRAMLPLTGTHANGVPLEPGDPLVDASIWPALLATALLAAAVTAIGSRPWRRARLLRRSAAGRAARPTRCTSGPAAPPVAGQRPDRRPCSSGLRGTSVAPLLLVAAGTVPLGLWLWADPAMTAQLVALLLMPVGTTLLPVLTWQAVAPAWRALGTRPPSPAALAARLALVDASAVVVFGLWCGVLLGAGRASGGPGRRAHGAPGDYRDGADVVAPVARRALARRGRARRRRGRDAARARRRRHRPGDPVVGRGPLGVGRRPAPPVPPGWPSAWASARRQACSCSSPADAPAPGQRPRPRPDGLTIDGRQRPRW